MSTFDAINAGSFSLDAEKATLRKVTQGGYTISTGAAAHTTADYDCWVAASSKTSREFESIIQSGDRQVLIDAPSLASGVSIHPRDRLVLAGSEFEIVDLKVMYEGVRVSAYKALLRGGPA